MYFSLSSNAVLLFIINLDNPYVTKTPSKKALTISISLLLLVIRVLIIIAKPDIITPNEIIKPIVYV
jgi:hypothetical protein